MQNTEDLKLILQLLCVRMIGDKNLSEVASLLFDNKGEEAKKALQRLAAEEDQHSDASKTKEETLLATACICLTDSGWLMATHSFRKVLQYNPSVFEAWFGLGYARSQEHLSWGIEDIECLSLNDFLERRRCWETCVALRSDVFQVHFNLAHLLIVGLSQQMVVDKENDIKDVENAIAKMKQIDSSVAGIDRLEKDLSVVRVEKTYPSHVISLYKVFASPQLQFFSSP